MSESTVLYQVENRIATITLNRPDKHNAMNYDLANDLHAAMIQADADDEVRVIVFTGAGKSFCVGADISAINRSNAKAAGAAPIGTAAGAAPGTAPAAPAPKPRNMSTLFWPMDAGIRPDFQATHNYFPMIGKPIICMINGATAGVGISYACFSDMRFSADDVTFAAGFVQRGIAAEWGTSWILPKLIGHGNASDFLLSGRKVKAPEALQMGMLNRIVPRDQLEAVTYEYAANIATWCAPVSLRLQKRQIWESYYQTLGESNMMFKDFTRICGATEDLREAGISFMEKRPPNFKGR